MTVSVPPEFLPRVRRNEPLTRHTSWHVGGPAELFFVPRDRSDLTAFLRALPLYVPVHFIGLGSNVLVRDGGLPGVVISTRGTLDRFDRLSQTTVFGEAGLACARLARQCVKWGMGSAAFFAGIPGTLGGALAMNAGAFGGETWPHVVTVETVDRRGMIHTRPPGEYQVGYREVVAGTADEWFLSARLMFEARDEGSEERVREMLERRRASQPIGEWSCGSVFRNPAGLHAARLIEQAGLKGFAIGEAEVSPKHANFFINRGNATASDLERLILHVQETVERLHGVRLVPEVRIIGNTGPVLS
jgi:UDP-N-acetylmuramate dehydrogenase